VARATPARSKFCIEEQGFVRAGFCTRSGYAKFWLTRKSCQSIEPKAVLEHRAPKTSPPILHSRSVESKVGRAVHCAPVWVVLTRLPGLNLFPRPYERGYSGACIFEGAVNPASDGGALHPSRPLCVVRRVPDSGRGESRLFNRAESGAGAPRSKNFLPILHSRSAESR